MGRTLHVWLCLAACLAAAVPSPAADARPETRPPRFEASAEMVELDLSIQDRGGRTVPGVTLPDLTVLEDGVPQRAAYLVDEPRPLALILFIDCSASLERTFGRVQEAAERLVRSLRPADAAEIRTISTRAAVVQELTGDHELLASAIARLRPSGDTALHDALYIALSERRWAEAADGRRPVVVLITDGIDTASHVSDDQVLERARERRALSVFAIGLTPDGDAADGPPDVDRSRYFLAALGNVTGGRAFFPARADAIPHVFDLIAEELGGRYSLGYQPTNAAEDGGWRRIAVRVSGRPGIEVRTRAGYYADGPRRTGSAAR